MVTFKDRHGQWHESKPHIATFNGSHNAMKSKCLIYLSQSQEWLSVSMLAQAANVNYESLRVKISLWYKWRYIKRRVANPNHGRPYFEYHIDQRGQQFCDIRIPKDKFAEYVRQIECDEE